MQPELEDNADASIHVFQWQNCHSGKAFALRSWPGITKCVSCLPRRRLSLLTSDHTGNTQVRSDVDRLCTKQECCTQGSEHFKHCRSVLPVKPSAAPAEDKLSFMSPPAAHYSDCARRHPHKEDILVAAHNAGKGSKKNSST